MELFNATQELMLRIYEILTIWVALIFAGTAWVVAVVYGLFLWSECRSLSPSPSRARRIDITSGDSRPSAEPFAQARSPIGEGSESSALFLSGLCVAGRPASAAPA